MVSGVRYFDAISLSVSAQKYKTTNKVCDVHIVHVVWCGMMVCILLSHCSVYRVIPHSIAKIISVRKNICKIISFWKHTHNTRFTHKSFEIFFLIFFELFLCCWRVTLWKFVKESLKCLVLEARNTTLYHSISCCEKSSKARKYFWKMNRMEAKEGDSDSILAGKVAPVYNKVFISCFQLNVFWFCTHSLCIGVCIVCGDRDILQQQWQRRQL